MPNAIAKPLSGKAALVGDAIVDAGAVSGVTLRRPVDRGHVVNWDAQRAVWGRAVRGLLGARPRECGLVLAVPPLCLPAVVEGTRDAVFHDLGFRSALLAPAHELIALAWAVEAGGGAGGAPPPAAAAVAGIVVDVGFSATTAAAVFDGRLLPDTVRRIDLGGKALTNMLKEAITYRRAREGRGGATVWVGGGLTARRALPLSDP